jgi:hypothetical protein
MVRGSSIGYPGVYAVTKSLKLLFEPNFKEAIGMQQRPAHPSLPLKPAQAAFTSLSAILMSW